MEIPRNNRELGVFVLGFFVSAFIVLAAIFVVARLPYAGSAASGMAAGDSSGLALGLFIIGVIAGLATVVKSRERR